jgi:D-glycero-D-manno-heptose 1,7-bisphosphate phosphatase
METCFIAAGAPLAAVYYCPFHPDGLPPYNIASPSRKPGAGMLLQAAQEHALDLSHSVLLGDQESDILAGKTAGLMQTALFSQEDICATQANITLANHAKVCEWLNATYQRGAF